MKKNNKGFTLVELIVVIAILGVLMAVLVPQYIQYVDKSRQSADEAAIGEVAHAIEVASAEEDVYDQINDGNATVTVSAGTITVNPATGALKDAIDAVCDASDIKFNSDKYNDKSVQITIDSKGKTTVKDPVDAPSGEGEGEGEGE